MKDTITDLLDVLVDLSRDLDGDAFSRMFYGIDGIRSNPSYMSEKFGRFQRIGIVWAWNSLDAENRRRLVSALVELVEQKSTA